MSSYTSSTQKKYWTFKEEELLKYRRNANYKYIHSDENSIKVGFEDAKLN